MSKALSERKKPPCTTVAKPVLFLTCHYGLNSEYGPVTLLWQASCTAEVTFFLFAV